MNGPLRTLVTTSKCCGAARHCGPSPQPQNQLMGEFTQCGQTGLMHSRLLLAQHFFAVAAHHIWQRSIFHQSSRSN
jgi:hypothetical protein